MRLTARARGARLQKVKKTKATLDHDARQAMAKPIHSTISPTICTIKRRYRMMYYGDLQ